MAIHNLLTSNIICKGTGHLQVVAVDWIFSFRIKCVGLEPIFGSYDVTENRAVLNILEGQ